MDWDRKRYSHFIGWGDSLFPYFESIFPPHATTEYVDNEYYNALKELGALGNLVTSQGLIPTWAWFLVDESGGADKSKRLMNQFRALNLPAIREGAPYNRILFDEIAASASVLREGGGGVLLSPYDLYLHRNIGFSPYDYNMDIGDLIRDESFPERCGIERRLSEGTFEIRPRPNGQTYWFWVRGPSSEVWERRSFHNLGREIGPSIYGYLVEPLLVYVCD